MGKNVRKLMNILTQFLGWIQNQCYKSVALNENVYTLL